MHRILSITADVLRDPPCSSTPCSHLVQQPHEKQRVLSCMFPPILPLSIMVLLRGLSTRSAHFLRFVSNVRLTVLKADCVQGQLSTTTRRQNGVSQGSRPIQHIQRLEAGRKKIASSRSQLIICSVWDVTLPGCLYPAYNQKLELHGLLLAHQKQLNRFHGCKSFTMSHRRSKETQLCSHVIQFGSS
jgi:hypothetical protein